MIQVFAFIQTSYIMNSGIKNTFVPAKNLEIASKLIVFLQYNYLVTFGSQYIGTKQSPHPATDDYKIILSPWYIQFFLKINNTFDILVGNSCISKLKLFFNENVLINELSKKYNSFDFLLNLNNLVERYSDIFVLICLSFKSVIPSRITIIPFSFRALVHFSRKDNWSLLVK